MGSYVESFPGPGQGPADEKVMPIAVVGLGFRGPGDATDVESLYRMILEAREAWSPVPKSKWNNDAFYHPEANHNGTVSKALAKMPAYPKSLLFLLTVKCASWSLFYRRSVAIRCSVL